MTFLDMTRSKPNALRKKRWFIVVSYVLLLDHDPNHDIHNAIPIFTLLMLASSSVVEPSLADEGSQKSGARAYAFSRLFPPDR